MPLLGCDATVGAGDHRRTIGPRFIDDRRTHAGPRIRVNRNATAVHAMGIQIGEQLVAKIISTHPPDHCRARAETGGRHRLSRGNHGRGGGQLGPCCICPIALQCPQRRDLFARRAERLPVLRLVKFRYRRGAAVPAVSSMATVRPLPAGAATCGRSVAGGPNAGRQARRLVEVSRLY